MKIWQILAEVDLTEEAYGDYAELHGTKYWAPVYNEEDVLNRDEPMYVHFAPGSSVIAEIVWVWGMYACIADKAIQQLQQFKGWVPLQTCITPPEENKRSNQIVAYPYIGPELKVLWITHWVSMNETWSTFTKQVRENGDVVCNFDGIEEVEREWIPLTDNLKVHHKKREAGKGIFIEKSELKDNDFFRLRQWPGQMMCTDRVRDFCIENGYRNIAFLEAGDVIEPQSGRGM